MFYLNDLVFVLDFFFISLYSLDRKESLFDLGLEDFPFFLLCVLLPLFVVVLNCLCVCVTLFIYRHLLCVKTFAGEIKNMHVYSPQIGNLQ